MSRLFALTEVTVTYTAGGVTVTPDAQTLSLTLHTPTIITASGTVVTPDTQTLSLTLNAPTVIFSGSVSPDAQALTLTLNSPTIYIIEDGTVYPDTLTLTAELYDVTPSIKIELATQQILSVQLQEALAIADANTYIHCPSSDPKRLEIYVSGSKVETKFNDYSEFHGGIIKDIDTKAADYTTTEADYTIVIDASSNSVVVTLPASPDKGQVFNIACLDSTYSATIDFNGKNFYKSTSTESLYEGDNLKVQYDGTQWIGA